MRAEWYKLFHRKYPYATLLLLLAGSALLVAGWVFTNSRGNTVEFQTGGGVAVMMLSMGLYLAVIICDMVYSDQYKFNTLKNEVSFGLPRARIFLGKLGVQMVTGVAMSVAVLAFYELLCYLLLLPSTPEVAGATLRLVLYCTVCAIPQWLAILAVSNLAFFLIRSNTAAAITAVAAILVPQNVLKLMGLMVDPVFARAAAWMPGAIIDNAQGMAGDGRFLALSWLAGAVWIAGCTAAGLICFRKKEIN